LLHLHDERDSSCGYARAAKVINMVHKQTRPQNPRPLDLNQHILKAIDTDPGIARAFLPKCSDNNIADDMSKAAPYAY